MKNLIFILLCFVSLQSFAQQDSVLTKQGYKQIRFLHIGDSVKYFDTYTGKVAYNAIISIDTVVPHYDTAGCKDIKFYTINNKWTFYSEQLLWADTGVRHARELVVGDTIYNDKNKSICIKHISSQLIPGRMFYRFEVTGDHSFIMDGMTLHNSSLYWIKASGNYGSGSNWCTDTTNWTVANTTPSSSVSAIYTKAAGSVTCTMDGTYDYCLNCDMHGWIGTINGGVGALSPYGNVYLKGTISISNILYLWNTTSTTFAANGLTIPYLRKQGIGGTTQMVGSFTVTNYLYLTNGTMNFDGSTGTIGSIQLYTLSSTAAIIMGSGNITINGSGIDFATNAGSGFTFTCNTSQIHIIAGSSSTTFYGNNHAFNKIYFDGATAGGIISGSNTIDSLVFAPSPAAAITVKFTNGTTQTVKNFIATGTSGAKITIESTSTSAGANISSTGNIGCTNDYLINGVSGSYYGVSYTGSATGYLGTNSTHPGNSSGWTYTSGSGCGGAAPTPPMLLIGQ